MTLKRRAGLLLAAVLLAGCTSKAPAPDPPTERQSLDRSARLAFDQGHYAQAGTLYASALEQALLEDDPRAIIDARFNLALTYTYLGRYEQANAQLAQANAERRRRGLAPDPELMLLEATIMYRGGRSDDAGRLLDKLFQLAPPGGAVSHRGHFIAGLIAADNADRPALQRHILALQQVTSSDVQADLLELQGVQAGQQGDTRTAYARFDEAVVLRSIDRDYRGMVRVLAAAGELAGQAGDRALAASYYLRAGRSAAQRGEPEARVWLQQAREFGAAVGDAPLVLEANDLLDALDSAE